MSNVHLVDALESHDFLHVLDEHQRMILVSGAQPFSVNEGEYLFHEGGTANAFYLIQSGSAQLEWEFRNGSPTAVTLVGPGDVVGWSWALEPYRFRFSCRALSAVKGLYFDAAWLRDLCDRDCYLGYRLMKKLLEVVANRLTKVSTHFRGPSPTRV